MRYCLLFTLFALFPLVTMGQSISSQERPAWAGGYFKEMPNSYIEVVSAFGYDLKEARDKAAKEAIHRRSLATGTEATVNISGNDVNVSSNHDVIVKARIVDEYIHHTSNGYTVYLLVQTAKNPTFQYEPVNVSREYGFSARAFVPGMAQIHKGSVTKGSLFIAGECLFIAGIVSGQLLADDCYNKSLTEKYNADVRKAYVDKANSYLIMRNISIAGAAAVYIWNVVDGIVAKGKKHVVVGNAALTMAPYADMNSAGLAINITF